MPAATPFQLLLCRAARQERCLCCRLWRDGLCHRRGWWPTAASLNLFNDLASFSSSSHCAWNPLPATFDILRGTSLLLKIGKGCGENTLLFIYLQSENGFFKCLKHGVALKQSKQSHLINCSDKLSAAEYIVLDFWERFFQYLCHFAWFWTMKQTSNHLSLCEIELPSLVSRQKKMANHREWPCCHIFFSLCIIPGTKQHLSGTTISSYRDIFSEWIKFIFQQKGSQLHNVLARILLLFPAFYLLPQHIQLPHHLWGTELSLKGYLSPSSCSHSQATHTSSFLHSRKAESAPGLAQWLASGKDLCLQSGRESWAQASQCCCITCHSHPPRPHEKHVVDLKIAAISHSVLN